MPNATVTAAATAKAKAALAKAIRQRNNENTAKFFAVGMAGLIVLFMIFHWTRLVFRRYESKEKGSLGVFQVPVAISRYPFLPLLLEPRSPTCKES